MIITLLIGYAPKLNVPFGIQSIPPTLSDERGDTAGTQGEEEAVTASTRSRVLPRREYVKTKALGNSTFRPPSL